MKVNINIHKYKYIYIYMVWGLVSVSSGAPTSNTTNKPVGHHLMHLGGLDCCPFIFSPQVTQSLAGRDMESQSGFASGSSH